MKRRLTFLALLLSMMSVGLYGQVTLSIGDYTAACNGDYDAEVSASGFTDIQGFQFSVNWDPAFSTYTGFSSPIGGVVVNANAGAGTFTITYFDITNPITLADGSTILTLEFDLVAVGGQDSILITDNPTAIEVIAGLQLLDVTVDNGTITVEDNEDPVVTCPADLTVQESSPGSGTATVNGIAPVSTSDNCGVASVTYALTGATNGSGNDDASGTLFNVGTTNVEYEVSDASGNTGLCDFDVVVEANNGGGGNTDTITLSLTHETVNCGAIFTYDISADGISNVDTMNFSLNFDASVVTYVSTSNNIPSGTLTLDASNAAGGQLGLSWVGSDLNLANGTALYTITFDASGSDGDVAATDIGNVPVAVYASNENGPFTVESGSGSITLDDTFGPNIDCPGDINIQANPGQTSVVVNNIAPMNVSDLCSDDVTVTYSITGATTANGSDDASGSSFNIGVSTVEYTALDEAGNTNDCEFDVTVSPATAGADTITLVVQDVTVNCDGQAVVGIEVYDFSNIYGLQFSVNWDETGLGYVSTTENFANGLVSINDLNTANGEMAISWADTQAVSLPDGFVIIEITFDALGAVGDVVSVDITNTPVTIEASNLTDIITVMVDNGEVTIADLFPPEIVCPPDQTVEMPPLMVSATVTGIGPQSVTDDCGIVSVTYDITGATTGSGNDDASGTVFNAGTSTIEYIATDLGGNTDTCAFDLTMEVTVTDTLLLFASFDTASCGETVSVDITVGDFIGIGGLQFTLNWDETLIDYQSSTWNIGTGLAQVNDVNVSNGEFSISWADTVDTDLADGYSILTLDFAIVGDPEVCTPIQFVQAPVPTEASSAEYLVLVPVITEDGEVCIIDDIPPVALCNDLTIFLDANGEASIATADVDAGTTDNCQLDTVYLDQYDFDCDDLGANTVTLTGVDEFNNVGTCTSTVTVVDDLDPTAVCQDITVQLDDTGNGSIVAGDVNNGSSDNCTITSMSVDDSDFTCSDVGVVVVTLTVTDQSGNSSTCESDVSVEDNVAPIAVCDDITIELQGADNVTIDVGQLDGGSTDACGIASVTASQLTFGVNDIGVNSVTVTVTDNNGNVSTCTSLVTVVQAAPCMITCPDDITVNNDPGQCGAFVDGLLPDFSAACIPAALVVGEDFANCSEPAGWGIDDGTGDPGNGYSGVTSDGGGLGNCVVYNITDIVGGGAATSNPSFSGCFAGVIDDGLAVPDNLCGFGCITIPVNLPAGFSSPSFSMNWEHQAFAGGGDMYVDFWDGSDWVNVAFADNDSWGDIDQQFLTDNSDLAIRFCYDDEGGFQWGAGFDNLEVFAVDPNGVPSAINDYNGGSDASDYYPVGTTTVTYTVPGQTVSCSFNVTVVDAEPPALSCPSDQTINLDAGECDQIYNYQVSAVDNCPSTPFGIAGPFCDPCDDPSSGSALACAPFAQNSIIQSVDIGGFIGNITEMCYNQETFGNIPLATINLYVDDGSGVVPYTGGGFTPIASQVYQTSTLDNGSCVCVAFDNPAVADGSFTAVWVEAFTPGTTLNSRIVQTPATCDGNFASGNDTYIVAPACGLGTPGTFASLGFVLDASFALTVQPNEVTPVPDPAAPPGFNAFEDGDFLPIGFHCWQYVAVDEAGNIATCSWCVTVAEYPFPISELVCNDNVNVSLDENCEAIVTADMILEGGPYGCYDNYVVSINGGDNFLNGNDVGQVYEVVVTDPATGNSCWGYITVEDKQIPDLECASYEVACSENPLPGTLVNGVINFDFAPGVPVTAGTPAIADMDVSSPADDIQDLNVYLDIPHSWIGDMTASLTSPEGTTIMLFDNIGGPGFGCAGNDLDVTFDDEAAATYADLDGTCNNAPAAQGTFQPLEALSAFDGQNPNGTWTLEVIDNFGGDDGTIANVTLSMKLPNSQAIEFPLPDDVTIVPPSGEGPFTVFGFDPCGPVTLSFEDVSEGGDMCAGQYSDIVYRNWTAVDPSGNTSTCQDTFFLTRAGLADVSPPTNYNGLDEFALHCATPYSPFLPFGPNNWDANQNGYPDPAETGEPGGFCANIMATYDDIELDGNTSGCAGELAILRNWTVFDMCTGDLRYISQMIKVLDFVPPVLDCPAEIIVYVDQNCEGNLSVPQIDAYDECSMTNVPYTVTVTGGVLDVYGPNTYVVSGLLLGNEVLIYTADDGCGNTASCEVPVIIVDNISPVPICDVNTVVSLGSDGTARIYAETFDDGSYDNCGIATMLVRRIRPNGGADRSCEFENGNYRPYVSFCCDDLSRDDVMVELIVTDFAGNSNTCMVNVDVDDKLPPFMQPPNDVTVSCDFPFDVWTLEDNFGKVVIPQNGEVREITIVDDPNGNGITEILDGYAADNCSVTVEELPFNDNDLECGQGRIVRVWRATDQDGRRFQVSQRITVIDFDPFFICDVVAKCTGAPATSCNPSRYTEVDDANWPCDILIEVCTTDVMSLDPDQLALSSMRNEITRRPVSEAAYPEVYDDNCSQVAMAYEDEIFTIVPDACFKILRHWSIIDWCQFDEDTGEGRWNYTQVIKVLDAEAPVFMACEDVTFCDTVATNCSGFADLSLQVMDCTPLDQLVANYRIDVDNDGIYEINGSGTDASGNYPFGTHKVQWIVEDLCGNTSTCEYLFTTADCKKPSPVCINGLSTVTMPVNGCITINAEVFDASSFDNCSGDLLFTYSSDILDVTRTFCCDDLGTVEVEIWVTDAAGNQDYCSTFISIQDPNQVCGDPSSTIAGLIQTETGTPVKNVEVGLENETSNMDPYMTNSNGAFAFNDMDDFQAYEVMPNKDINVLDGVTTYDLALIQRHILQTGLLDSPYKLIAADANKDGAINVLDVVSIRKVILGLEDVFVNNTSWRFVDADQVFPAGLTAPPVDVRETVLFDILLIDELETDFVGVKIGDVNGNAEGSDDGSGAETRSFGSTINFEMVDQKISADNEIRIPVTSSNFEEVLGYQFTLMTDNDVVSFKGIEAGAINMTKSNYGTRYADRGMVTISWNEVTPVSVAADEVLFTLIFDAVGEGTISDVLAVSSAKTIMEAYKGSEVVGVALGYKDVLDESDVFVVYQNMPNPFTETTIVQINMPTADEANVTIMDVTGKIVHEFSMEFSKGLNQFELTRNELSAAGIYYYQISTTDHTATKKLVVE